MSEKEPLEDIVRRFQHGGLESVMTMSPRVVKLGAPQVIQIPRMRTQAQIVEESRPEQRKRKTRRSLKKRKQRRRMMRRNIPTRRNMKRGVRKRWIKIKRKKVKMRKRRQCEKVDDLSDQLREEQEITEAKKQKYGGHRQREHPE